MLFSKQDEFIVELLPLLREIQADDPSITYYGMAVKLNKRGIRTFRGARWSEVTMMKVMNHVGMVARKNKDEEPVDDSGEVRSAPPVWAFVDVEVEDPGVSDAVTEVGAAVDTVDSEIVTKGIDPNYRPCGCHVSLVCRCQK